MLNNYSPPCLEDKVEKPFSCKGRGNLGLSWCCLGGLLCWAASSALEASWGGKQANSSSPSPSWLWLPVRFLLASLEEGACPLPRVCSCRQGALRAAGPCPACRSSMLYFSSWALILGLERGISWHCSSLPGLAALPRRPLPNSDTCSLPSCLDPFPAGEPQVGAKGDP